MTQAQICQLLGRERSVITKHINNAIREGEVSLQSNVQNLHIANSDKPVKVYGGMNFLAQQLSSSNETPRRKIGFGVKPGETSDTPYGLAK